MGPLDLIKLTSSPNALKLFKTNHSDVVLQRKEDYIAIAIFLLLALLILILLGTMNVEMEYESMSCGHELMPSSLDDFETIDMPSTPECTT